MLLFSPFLAFVAALLIWREEVVAVFRWVAEQFERILGPVVSAADRLSEVTGGGGLGRDDEGDGSGHGGVIRRSLLRSLPGGELLNLVGFEHGGIATSPTPGVFGEAGPEALIPLDRLWEMLAPLPVGPVPQAAGVGGDAGGGGDRTFSFGDINVYTSGQTGAEIARDAGTQVRDEMRTVVEEFDSAISH